MTSEQTSNRLTVSGDEPEPEVYPPPQEFRLGPVEPPAPEDTSENENDSEDTPVLATLTSYTPEEGSPVNHNHAGDLGLDDSDDDITKSSERLARFETERSIIPVVNLAQGENITDEPPEEPEEEEDIADNDDGTEWEETLIYVDLDELVYDTELFAVNPDDYVSANTTSRDKVDPTGKDLNTEVTLKFHNLDSANPIMQHGSSYFLGTYEESFGSMLFFQKKPDVPVSKTKTKLKSLLKKPEIPRDKVFHEQLDPEKSEYELVANITKMLKLQKKEAKSTSAQSTSLPATPGGMPSELPKIPKHLSTRSILLGAAGKNTRTRSKPKGQSQETSKSDTASRTSVVVENQHSPGANDQLVVEYITSDIHSEGQEGLPGSTVVTVTTAGDSMTSSSEVVTIVEFHNLNAPQQNV